jgi:hypothetical protein
LYFYLNNNLWAPQTCAYATLRQSVANLTFRNVSFNFATAISKFDTFSLYHIVHTQIAKVTASFSLFALLELVCTKKVPNPIHYSLLIYPKLILLWSVPDRQTDREICSPLVSIGHPPLSLASPVNLRLREGPRALSGKKRIREQGVKNLVRQSVCQECSKGE